MTNNRYSLILQDGSLAWDAKEFLIEQDRCAEVTIEQKSYPGKSFSEEGKENKKKMMGREIKERTTKQNKNKERSKKKSKKEDKKKRKKDLKSEL